MEKKPRSFNFKNFDVEVWKTLKKEATEREMSFQKLVQDILKEWIHKNIKKE